jgi:hypothetical protein
MPDRGSCLILTLTAVYKSTSAREPALSAPTLAPFQIRIFLSALRHSVCLPVALAASLPPVSLFKWPCLNCIHAWTWTVGMAKGQWMPRLWLWATRM